MLLFVGYKIDLAKILHIYLPNLSYQGDDPVFPVPCSIQLSISIYLSIYISFYLSIFSGRWPRVPWDQGVLRPGAANRLLLVPLCGYNQEKESLLHNTTGRKLELELELKVTGHSKIKKISRVSPLVQFFCCYITCTESLVIKM